MSDSVNTPLFAQLENYVGRRRRELKKIGDWRYQFGDILAFGLWRTDILILGLLPAQINWESIKFLFYFFQ